MVSYRRSKESLRDDYDKTQFVPTMPVANMAQTTLVASGTAMTAATTYSGSTTLMGVSNFIAAVSNSHSSADTGNIAMYFELERQGQSLGIITAGGTVGDSATSTFLLSSDLIAVADTLRYTVSAAHSADYELGVFLAFNPTQSTTGGTAAITINGYDSVADVLKVEEQDPLSQQRVASVPFNIAAGAAVSGTTSEYIDMDGYNSLSFQVTATGAMSMVVATTLQDDGTAASACNFIDVTTSLHSFAAFTATTTIRDTTNFFAGCKYAQFSLTQSSSAGTSTFKLQTTKHWV